MFTVHMRTNGQVYTCIHVPMNFLQLNHLYIYSFASYSTMSTMYVHISLYVQMLNNATIPAHRDVDILYCRFLSNAEA